MKILKLIKEQLAQKGTSINGNLTNKISRENQSYDSLRASVQEQAKEKQWPKKLGNNQPKATAWKDGTSEQTNKVITVGDSIFSHLRGYDLSHSLENCKVHVKNFPLHKRYINK